jgi:23S rRNA U2552 (ribose-2'-O)-methylase RlmE/FtsJ
MNNLRLTQLFFEHDGKLTDKWEQYLGIYQGEMERFIVAGKPVRLLEIGVQNGGSLEVWSKFLPQGSTIIGIDIDPAVGDLKFAGNIRAFVADVNDVEKVEGYIGTEPFDIIIDDGSHTSPDIISTFKRLFSKLAPGGKYFAEDLHCSYWKSHQGGLRLQSSSVEYFKNIVDALNADHFEANDCLSAEAKTEISDLSRQIARITFYDSVVVIEKLIAEKQRPYRHLLSGQETPVNSPVDFIAAAPSELIRPWLVGDAAARSIDTKLKDELQRLRGEIEVIRDDRTRLAISYAARNSVGTESLRPDWEALLTITLKVMERTPRMHSAGRMRPASVASFPAWFALSRRGTIQIATTLDHSPSPSRVSAHVATPTFLTTT